MNCRRSSNRVSDRSIHDLISEIDALSHAPSVLDDDASATFSVEFMDDNESVLQEDANDDPFQEMAADEDISSLSILEPQSQRSPPLSQRDQAMAKTTARVSWVKRSARGSNGEDLPLSQLERKEKKEHILSTRLHGEEISALGENTLDERCQKLLGKDEPSTGEVSASKISNECTRGVSAEEHVGSVEHLTEKTPRVTNRKRLVAKKQSKTAEKTGPIKYSPSRDLSTSKQEYASYNNASSSSIAILQQEHQTRAIQEKPSTKPSDDSSIRSDESDEFSMSLCTTTSDGEFSATSAFSKHTLDRSIMGNPCHKISAARNRYPAMPCLNAIEERSISDDSIQSSASSRVLSAVERARQLFRDVSLGSPRRFFSGHTAEHDIESDPPRRCFSSKDEKETSKTRKCAWAGAIIVILLLFSGTMGILAGLDYISIPHVTKQVDDTEGPLSPTFHESDEEQKPVKEQGGNASVSLEMAWYADWNLHQCVQDCGGTPPCNNSLDNYDSPASSLKECCMVNFAGFIGDHWSLKECMSNAVYATGNNGSATVVQEGGVLMTAYPTLSPTLQTITVMPVLERTEISNEPTEATRPAKGPTTPIPAVKVLLYYANFDSKQCIYESSDGKKPWDIGYESEVECCEINFGWYKDSDCFGGDHVPAPVEASGRPTERPVSLSKQSPVGAMQPPPVPNVESSSPKENTTSVLSVALYYADFDMKWCTQKRSSTKRPRDTGYKTKEDCCQINFPRNEDHNCYSVHGSNSSDTRKPVNHGISNYVVASIPLTPRVQSLPPSAFPTSHHPSGLPTSLPSETVTYYANFATKKCVREDSGQRQKSEVSYDTEEKCCLAYFSRYPDSKCYIGVDSGESILDRFNPSVSPPDEPHIPTSFSSTAAIKYYANYATRKCVLGDPDQRQAWEASHDTEEDCCLANFSGYIGSNCYIGNGSVIDRFNPSISTPHLSDIPTSLPSKTTAIKMAFYADFSKRKCVLADSSQRHKWEASHDNEEECCLANFSWHADSSCYSDGGSDTQRFNPPVPPHRVSDIPTSLPSVTDIDGDSTGGRFESFISPPTSHVAFSPDTVPEEVSSEVGGRFSASSNGYSSSKKMYYYNANAGTCTHQEGTTHQVSKLSRWTETGYESQEECCRNANCSSGGADIGAAGDGDVQMFFFADFGLNKCTYEDSQTKQAWDKRYKEYLECCVANFSWDVNGDCFAGDNPHAETDNGAKSGTGAQLSHSSNRYKYYYADFNTGKCNHNDSTQMQRRGTKYATEEECCDTSFHGNKRVSCHSEAAEESVVSSVEESSVPAARFRGSTQDPSKHPSPRPTPVPTRDPTLEPTKLPSKSPVTNQPTISPMVQATPTASPEISLSNRPSLAVTDFPSANPTQSPTTVPPTINPTLKPTLQPMVELSQKPSLFPSIRLTRAPTNSPIGRQAKLLMDLKAMSPLSSDYLDDIRSDQHRAMEWLLGDSNYDVYSTEQKVQRWALAIFYRSLYGEDWMVRDGWMRRDQSDECTWHGVVCDHNVRGGVVTLIDMSGNNLRGTIPPEITLLKNIEHLSLSKNLIRGFPSELFDMESLRVLDLNKNLIEKIPSQSGKNSTSSSWSGLERLFLSNNEIAYIPSDIFSKLQNLKHLSLSNNKLSSTIPSRLGQITTLEELNLDSNFFTGTIPPLYNLSRLRVLRLSDNILTGALSPLFFKMTSLSYIGLDSNYISGVIPEEIGLLGQLSELHLGDNELVGQLPWPQISHMTKLTHFDVSKNFLNSTIESEVGAMSNLVALRLDNNYRLNDGTGNIISYGMIGSIPESIGNLNLLQELRIDNNFLDGAIPSTLGNLQSLITLRMESNNFQSSIPSEFGNLFNLQYLHLWSNYLSSTICSELGNLNQLQELFLDDNELTGSIPSELGQLAGVNYISLAENHLDGVIPPTFGMLSNLKRLDVQFNYLYGEVPQQMANLSIVKMKLEGNYFYGDIPDGICKSVKSLSANCAATKRPTGSPTSNDGSQLSFGDLTDGPHNTPTSSPTYEYWWSCTCCTTCYPD